MNRLLKIEFLGDTNMMTPISPRRNFHQTTIVENTDNQEFFKMPSTVVKCFNWIGHRITERIVFGELKDNEYAYKGIVSRTKLAEFIEVNKPKRLCFPVALVMLYASNKSILQLRTIYNSSGDIGKYANISGRINDLDVFKTKRLKPSQKYLELTRDLNIEDNIVTWEFNREVGFQPGFQLPVGTWGSTAIREIQEELGLEIKPSRLRYHQKIKLEREEVDLLFHIYSLQLRRGRDIDELASIKKLRPQVNLDEFNLIKLMDYKKKDKLNKLLQEKFEDIFLRIFEVLDIEK